jgi:hypothetical protein
MSAFKSGLVGLIDLSLRSDSLCRLTSVVYIDKMQMEEGRSIAQLNIQIKASLSLHLSKKIKWQPLL